jgi:hypothetical protein
MNEKPFEPQRAQRLAEKSGNSLTFIEASEHMKFLKFLCVPLRTLR